MPLGSDEGQPLNHHSVKQIFRIIGGGAPAPTLVMGTVANTTVSAFYATVDKYHISPGLVFAGYDVAGAGKLEIVDGAGATRFSTPITAAGAAPFDLDVLLMQLSTAMTIRLVPVSGAIGTLTILPHKKKA